MSFEPRTAVTADAANLDRHDWGIFVSVVRCCGNTQGIGVTPSDYMLGISKPPGGQERWAATASV